jgi:outer membrane protein assembly factor BamB
VYGDHLYTVNNNGILTAYEAKTGQRVYQQRVGEGGAFTASPIAAAGKLYIATEDGDVFVVKAGPQYELIAKNPVGEAILATPALAGDLLIVRGAKHLFAI